MRHHPYAWDMPGTQGDPSRGVCYDPYGKSKSDMKSLGSARLSFLWDRAERVGNEMLYHYQLTPVMENT